MTLLSKHEKRDSRRLPKSANLSESLILSLFLYFFTCFVTEDILSPHGSRQWLECPQYTETNHMPVYGGINQVYAVTAGATVPAAFAGVQRGTNSPILVGNGKPVPRWWLVAAPTMDEQVYCQLKTASFMPFKSSTPYAKPFLTNSSGRYSSYLSNRGSSLGYTSSMGSMGFWISSCTTR